MRALGAQVLKHLGILRSADRVAKAALCRSCGLRDRDQGHGGAGGAGRVLASENGGARAIRERHSTSGGTNLDVGQKKEPVEHTGPGRALFRMNQATLRLAGLTWHFRPLDLPG